MTAPAEDLEARARRKEAVARLAERALAGTELPPLFQEAATLLTEVLGVEYGAIWELAPEREKLVLRAGSGWGDGHRGSVAVSAGRDSEAGYALSTGEPVIVDDLRVDARFRGPAAFPGPEAVSGLSVTVPGPERPYGILAAHSRRPSQFRGTEIRFAQRLAHILGEAIRRKAAEQALRQSTRFLEGLLNSLADVVFTVRMPERRIEYASRGIASVFGLEPEEVVGNTTRIIFPDETAFLEFGRKMQETLERGERRLQTESLFRHKDGTTFPAEVSLTFILEDGRLTSAVGVVHDLSARKQAEEALHRHAERLRNLHLMDRAILEARSPQAIAEVSVRRIRRLVPCQRASLSVYHPATSETTLLAIDTDVPTRVTAGTRIPLASFGPEETLRRAQINRIDDVRALPQPSPFIEGLQAEGVRSYINVPLTAQKELIGWLNLWADAPDAFGGEELQIATEVADHLAVAFQQARLREELERHAAELEARVAERTAELRDTNAELEAFSYSVSHDLRAPLRAMQGFAQALLEDCGDDLDSLSRSYATRVVSAAQRMDLLIQDLLAYSRVSRFDLQLQSVPLDSVLKEVLVQLHSAIEERNARIEVDPSLPWVRGHRSTLVQVLANLISNGIKFVALDVSPRVRIRGERQGPSARLWVEDNGIGIHAQHQERVFRVFERLHGEETYPGTGIGLAIVRKAVERMGGQVGVVSEQGRGSRFWIELPAAKEAD
jgi:PAS domain S-box-containing protein